MQLRGVIFDMDGTLLDSLGFWDDQWHKMGKKYLGVDDYRPPKWLDDALRTATMKECVALIRREMRIEEDVAETTAYFEASLWDYYEHQAKPKEGTMALLAALKAKGVKMGVATATKREPVMRVLGHFHILEYLDFVISCCDPDIMQGKDSPAVYEKALRLLGTPVAETAVFEDSCVALETAAKMGFRTVGVIDSRNFGHDRLRAAAEIIIEEHESLLRPDF